MPELEIRLYHRSVYIGKSAERGFSTVLEHVLLRWGRTTVRQKPREASEGQGIYGGRAGRWQSPERRRRWELRRKGGSLSKAFQAPGLSLSPREMRQVWLFWMEESRSHLLIIPDVTFPLRSVPATLLNTAAGALCILHSSCPDPLAFSFFHSTLHLLPTCVFLFIRHIYSWFSLPEYQIYKGTDNCKH